MGVRPRQARGLGGTTDASRLRGRTGLGLAVARRSAPACPHQHPTGPPNRPLTLAKGPLELDRNAALGRRSNWRAAPAPPLYRGGPALRAAPFPEASRTFLKSPPQLPPRPRACACALGAASSTPESVRPSPNSRVRAPALVLVRRRGPEFSGRSGAFGAPGPGLAPRAGRTAPLGRGSRD